MTELTGANLIAGAESQEGAATILSRDPESGETLEPAARPATPGEVARAADLAQDAGHGCAGLPIPHRAGLLTGIADALEVKHAAIIDVVTREAALDEDRVEGELARTTSQFRFIASVLREGSFLGATIDNLDGGSLRKYHRPIGPVAVFAASNFPLAFGVAGTDTASALAAGCPIVVKAHPSQPHTSELLARIIGPVVDGFAPPGTFSLLHGFDAGRLLVQHPAIQAVAFTGSYAGGAALMQSAASRESPIPVYAEMGSINPVVISPGAARAKPDTIGAGFARSLLQSGGQFCTKPGVLLIPKEAASLVDAIVGAVDGGVGFHLLSDSIREGWLARVAEIERHDSVDTLVPGGATGPERRDVRPILFRTTAANLVSTPLLLEECFGPAGILAVYEDLDDLENVLDALRGTLAAAIHAEPDEHEWTDKVLAIAIPKAGRIVYNSWPTGVPVTWATFHGGPFPTTSNSLYTSVGAGAINRFLRPVAFQGFPNELLPLELRDANPLKLPRRLDGSMEYQSEEYE